MDKYRVKPGSKVAMKDWDPTIPASSRATKEKGWRRT